MSCTGSLVGEVKGIEAASFLDGIASLVTGNSPVARNPEMKCSGFNALSHRTLISPIVESQLGSFKRNSWFIV